MEHLSINHRPSSALTATVATVILTKMTPGDTSAFTSTGPVQAWVSQDISADLEPRAIIKAAACPKDGIENIPSWARGLGVNHSSTVFEKEMKWQQNQSQRNPVRLLVESPRVKLSSVEF